MCLEKTYLDLDGKDNLDWVYLAFLTCFSSSFFNKIQYFLGVFFLHLALFVGWAASFWASVRDIVDIFSLSSSWWWEDLLNFYTRPKDRAICFFYIPKDRYIGFCLPLRNILKFCPEFQIFLPREIFVFRHLSACLAR